jgi:hypothetical protein
MIISKNVRDPITIFGKPYIPYVFGYSSKS